MTTNHELNVQAAEALEWKIGGQKIRVGSPGTKYEYLYCSGKAWSPAERIEDAMGLLELLPDDRRVTAEYGPRGVNMYRHPADDEFIFDPYVVKYDHLARAMAEAFVAAKKAEASG